MHPIKAYLLRNKVSANKLAEEVGITREHLYAIIRGERTPRSDTALAIEEATKGEIKAEWLIFPEKYKDEIEAYLNERELVK